MKPKNRYQTFYRDFYSPEIDEIFLANGLRFVERYDSRSQARRYKKVGGNPMESILGHSLIRQHVKGDKKTEPPKTAGVKFLTDLKPSELNIPNPEELSEEKLYELALRNLPAGTGYQTPYHNLMAAIMIRLFIPPLKNPRLEYEIDDGGKKIDLVLSNTEGTGFFGRLPDRFPIKVPFVFIEFKNYDRLEIENKEVDQLAGRFKARWGRFGIITYRRNKNEKSLLKRCQACVEKENYIICINDGDIISLLNRRLNNDDLDDFMEEKLQAVTLS